MTTPSTDAATPALAGFAPLRRAERLLVQACARGDIAKISLRRPEAGLARVSIRASFLAFMLRGALQPHGRRMQLLGAFIEGRLDLGDATIACSLWFYRCTFDSPVLLDRSQVAGGVTFAGCRLAGLLAESCSIAGDLRLNAGCTVDNDLRLTRARIAGDLDCARLDLSGGSRPAQPRRALIADAIQVGGDVRLTERFNSVGEVRFCGARVRGDFFASGRFNGNTLREGGRGAALLLDRIALGGALHFDGGFYAAGRVALRRARIGGDVDGSGANFDLLGDGAWEHGGSFVLDRARIDGALILRELASPLRGASFVDARVGILCDDASTWGERLWLDGFAYARLGEGAPLDSAFRSAWLERQEPAHLAAQFRLQPWRRLIRVLRRMGHVHQAGSIALKREHWLRRSGWVGSWAPPALRWLPRAGHGLLGLLDGHGHRPWRLIGWLVAVWLLCGGVYWAAAEQLPATTAALGADKGFSPLAYSLDRLLPLLELGQAGNWTAAAEWPQPMRWLGQAEAAIGWVLLLLLLASLAGWTERDRDTGRPH